MKDQLSSLDVHFLVRELQALVGARLQKAYQGPKERKRDLLFQFHKSAKTNEAAGEGRGGAAEGGAADGDAGSGQMAVNSPKLLFHVLLPGLAYLTQEKPPVARVPGQFAVFLRKWVGNARVVSVEQRSFEKILTLVFENKDGRRTLVLELIPPGNALLLNAEGKIMNLLEPQRHGSRLSRGGAQYVPPPPFFDTRNASAEEIAERLFVTEKDAIVKALAADLGLGGAYAEEVCYRAKIDKLTAKPTKQELAALARVVRELFDESLAPRVVGDEAYPFHLRTKEEGVTYPSFSAAIASLVPEEEPPETVAHKVKKDKAAEVVRQQEAALAGYQKAASENQRKGELLYEHYQEVKALLEEVDAVRAESGWAAVKQEFKGRLAKIDEEKGEITIELE